MQTKLKYPTAIILGFLRLAQAGDGCSPGRHCVCYDEIGECYSEQSPWGGTSQRPLRAKPDSPSKIGAEFHLFTLSNPNNYVRLSKAEPVPSEFEPSRKTVFIVHGFLSSGDDKGWMGNMKSRFLTLYDYNVVLVDWHNGANVGTFNLDYPKAAQNTRVVGDILGQLVQYLPETEVHCIGHSLGAHICGYAGKVQKLDRITGLDPAGPYFENTADFIRLDSKDAGFVDNIHTDGEPLWSAGFGMMQAIGDADFYPNGGKDQPGCRNLSGCSHGRSHDLYMDTIIPECTMTAFQCQSYETFTSGNCQFNARAEMGWNVPTNILGKYYLETKSKSPWCI